MNECTMMGCVGTDLEFNETKDGLKMAKFRLAVRSRRKGKDHTSWFSVVCWDRSAEKIGHIHKGDLVVVQGSLLIDEYQHKGETRTAVEIKGYRVLKVSMPRRDEGGDPGEEKSDGGW